MPIGSNGTPRFRQPITPRPDIGNRIGIRFRGDTDTADVFHGAYHVGVVDSTRDRTGDRWGIPNGGTRKRFRDFSAAARYVGTNGAER